MSFYEEFEDRPDDDDNWGKIDPESDEEEPSLACEKCSWRLMGVLLGISFLLFSIYKLISSVAATG